MITLLRISSVAALAMILTALPAPALVQQGSASQIPQINQAPRPTLGNSQTVPNGPTLPSLEIAPIGKLTRTQKDALVKANFKATQRDIDKLNKLVQTLDQEMKKANPNILSVSVVQQAGKIEKLAKKVKNEVKSY